MRRILRATRVLLLAAAASLVLASSSSARNGATPADWREDLGVLIEELEAIHPDPWFHADRSELLAAADELRERLPDLTWEESYAGFHRLIATLRDGHTRIQESRNTDLDLRHVQVRYALFPEGLYVIAVHPDHDSIVGGRVTRIGNVETAEAIARMEPLAPADNDQTVKDRLPGLLASADLLAGVGILDGVTACPVEVEIDGRRVLETVPIAATRDESAWTTALEEAGVEAPLYLRHPGKSYFFEPLPEYDAVYVHFRRVQDDEGETFREFCDRTFAYLDEHEVGRLIVDLRLNGGGDNYLNQPLIHGIIRNERINREGNLFVIVGRRTFSAAMCGTIDLERHTKALFAGEPTGAAPNHHGDAVPVELPHTGVIVSISALLWQNSDPRDHRPWLDPHLPVELGWDDYVHGRDPVLEACLAYETAEGGRPPMQGVAGAWLEEGVAVEDVLERCRSIFSSAERAKYDFSEHQLNAVGYELLGDGRTEDAIAVFRLNVELFPHQFNPWDSLGEALEGTGRTQEAIEAYRRSVEINPASRTGQAALRRLLREPSGG